LPETNFTCAGKVIGGYYADLETSCQMFHVCTIGQLEEPMDIKFLCLNGTVFDQETRVCERVDEVDCTKSEKFYYLNLELYGNTIIPSQEGFFMKVVFCYYLYFYTFISDQEMILMRVQQKLQNQFQQVQPPRPPQIGRSLLRQHNHHIKKITITLQQYRLEVARSYHQPHSQV
jgi:hypothetical protein